jgi:hypothetical protein
MRAPPGCRALACLLGMRGLIPAVAFFFRHCFLTFPGFEPPQRMALQPPPPCKLTSRRSV